MKEKILFIVIFLTTTPFVTFSSQNPINDTDHKRHPHGHQENILTIIVEEDKKTFVTEKETIERIFLHPEVRDRKVVVFSIIGAYRTGKSFFLDYCLRFLYAHYPSINNNETKRSSENWMGESEEPLRGFGWKGGSVAQTKGVSLWNDVFLYDTPTEKIAILVMDTQGLFEPRSTDEENGRIFGLSTLTSSIQIFNIFGYIQEDQMVHLEMATKMTAMITKMQKSKKFKPFQKLLFFFQNWADEDYEPYGYVGGKGYLDEKVLKVLENTYSKANKVRKSIRGSFDEISCFLSLFPGKNITKSWFKGEWGVLEPEYINGLKKLLNSLLSPQNLIKKSVLGKEITAGEFQGYIKTYFDAFANNVLPDVPNVLQMTIENHMQDLIEYQLKNYTEKMMKNLDFNQENFETYYQGLHEEAKSEAIKGFQDSLQFDDEESRVKFERKLMDKADDDFKILKLEMTNQFNQYVISISALVETLYESYKNGINSNVDYYHDEFESYINNKHSFEKEKAISNFDDQKELEIMPRKSHFREKLIKLTDDYYWNWKGSQIKIYKEKQIVEFERVAEVKLTAYKFSLDFELDVNKDPFLSYIEKRHIANKNSTLIDFVVETNYLNNPQIQLRVKNELHTNMDVYFKSWSGPKIILNNEILEKIKKDLIAEFDKISQRKLSSYKNSLDIGLDMNKDPFLPYIESQHNTKKSLTLSDFVAETNYLKNSEIQLKSKNKLHLDMDNYFQTWRGPKITENRENLERLRNEATAAMNNRYNELLRDCKEEINEIDYDSWNYENVIKGKVESMVDSFKSATTNYHNQELRNSKISSLVREMKYTVDWHLAQKNELSTKGRWVDWSSSRTGVPKYAAKYVSGYGETLYFARCYIGKDGAYAIGGYKPSDIVANFGYDGDQLRKSLFQIFLHINYSTAQYSWTRNDMISGGWNEDSENLYMCTVTDSKDGYGFIGHTTDGDWCYVGESGKMKRYHHTDGSKQFVLITKA